ncbi:MAG: histidine phosphatase family protein, partial [Methylococcales bacterium]
MTLLMVRHGQASFGKANYDELSERGHFQAYQLGLWLADHQHQFSHVRIGNMHRHKQTLDGIAKAYKERGLVLPENDVDADLNEFDHGSVFSAFMQQHAETDIVKAAAGGETRATGAMVYAALLAWANNSLGELPETWEAFGARARQAAARLHDVAEGETLVVSSGGLISRIAQAAMEVPDHRAIDLNISLRNSALSEFHARDHQWRLGMWNALPHLHRA